MKCLRNLSRSRYHSRRASTGSFIVRLFTSPVHFSSPGGLVPRAGKKGECWTFLDWRLNSENDSPVHGQPSSRLLGLVSPSVLALRLSPSLITIPGGAGPVRERTGPFGRHDDGGRERPKGPESEGNRGRPLTSLVLSLIPSVFHSARYAASRRSPCLALVPRARLRLTPIVMSGERREGRAGRQGEHTTKEASVRLGHKTLRTWMKNSSLW